VSVPGGIGEGLLARAEHALTCTERVFVGGALAFASLLLFVNVPLRYLFLAPISWAEELSLYLMAPHRNVLFSILYSAVAPVDRPDAIELAHAWVDTARQSVRRYAGGGVYQNFRDATMDAWDKAYFADNLDALQTIKRRFDPDGLFQLTRSSTSGESGEA
jgi:hypothetical protein